MRHAILLVLIVLVLGCGDSNRPSKPDNLIPQEKMSDILYDVFLLNAAKGINRTVLENNGILPESYVFEKYNIDSLQFAKSNDYYSYDTKTYEEIMERVKLRLEASKIINDSLEIVEKKLKDSLDLSKKPALENVNPAAIDSMPAKQN